MKYFLSLITSLLISGFLMAQAPMRTTVEYNGQKYPCYIIEYNLPPDETENVIKQKLKEEGYNSSSSKGFIVYRNARFKDLNSEEPQDVLFKVERKSKKDKDKSIVTMIAAPVGVIPADKVKGAKGVASVEPPANSASFLNSFQNNIGIQAHNLAVTNQESAVTSAEKRLKKLQDEQSKLEKKIKDYQSDLDTNKKDQQVQVNEISNQQKLLDQLKSQSAGQ